MIRATLRKFYFKQLGLQIQSGGYLGNISCNWPRNLTVGKDTIISDGVDFLFINPFSENNCLTIGDRVFIGRGCLFNCNSKITIGNDTLIGANTIVVDVNHGIKKSSKVNQQPLIVKEVVVGDDVAIGIGCMIHAGVTIGTGSLVVAGSMVTKSIPEYQIWIGNPARFLKNR